MKRVRRTGLSEDEKKAIREQISDGVPRELIADEMRISLRQVDGFRAHVDSTWLNQEQMLERAFRYACARARNSGYPCLTWDECLQLGKKNGWRCELTGVKFSNKCANPNGRILRYPFRPSIDRKGRGKSYGLSNVRIVTQWANFARGEWSDGTFAKMCTAAVQWSARQ